MASVKDTTIKTEELIERHRSRRPSPSVLKAQASPKPKMGSIRNVNRTIDEAKILARELEPNNKIATPFLSVADVRKLFKEEKLNHLFVLNTADLRGKRQTGEITMGFMGATPYDYEHVKLPITFIPLDIANYCDLAKVVNDKQIAQNVMKGVMYIVKEDIYHALFNKFADVYERERDRIQLSSDEARNNQDIIDEERSSVKKIQPRGSVIRIIEEKSSDREKLSKLENIEDSMTRDDLRYVLANNESDNVKEWARKLLTQNEREDDDEDDDE